MYLHSSSGVMKKHTREQIADWVKENEIHNKKSWYEGGHPTEVEKRRKYGLKLWNIIQNKKIKK